MTLRIDPDGTITELPEGPLDAARAEFQWTSVVTCRTPFLDPDMVFVGVIDDFGAADRPINRKAWGLYGRSAIYGPMFFGRDITGHVPPEVIAIVTHEIADWPIPDQAKATLMHSEPDRPDMLHERPES